MLLRDAILADIKAEITVLHQELRQETEAIHSETSTSLQDLCQDVEEEISDIIQG